MKRIQRSFALFVAVVLVLIGTVWSTAGPAGAHTCVVVSVLTTTIGPDDPLCRTEAMTTPPGHMCTTVNTGVTVIACRELLHAAHGSGN